jgi:scyllo-inositol 2-dehydrogenase (NADP+)
MTINVGILGAGRSGWDLHAGPLQSIEGFRVSAICDVTPARLALAAKTFKVKTYGNPRELITDPDVDLVVVAIPNSMHTEYVIAALKAGKHVICEKPMTLTVAEADAMIAAADRAIRTLVVFHNRHWDDDYQMVKSIIRQGLLGEIMTIESRVMTYGPEWLTFGAPEYHPTWRIESAYGGGFLNDWGGHMLEQLLDLTDEYPTSVSCHLRGGVWATETDDYYDLKLSMPSGLLVTAVGTNDAQLPLPRWFVVGRQGTLVADGAWGNWTDMHVRRTVDGLTMDLAPQSVSPASGARSMDVSDTLSAHFYGDLREVLASGRRPEIPVERARDAIAIIEAARRSSTIGQAVAPVAPKGEYKRGEYKKI